MATDHGTGHSHHEDHGRQEREHAGREHAGREHTGREHAGREHAGREHAAGHGPLGGLVRLFVGHSHDSADQVDQALEGSREGLGALWLSLAGLGLTAALQALAVAWTGSVALLGDTLHNVADALTALPLAVAFVLGRRPPNRRYTYGYGRAEDLAGIVIVLFIAVSALVTGYEAVQRLLHPAPVRYLGTVAAAAVIGFVGNELVAQLRVRVGRRIGSAALVADGLHARADGLTSLAVLLGAGGLALGWHWADPVVGLLITIAISVVGRRAALEVYRRLMDAVDPEVRDACERALLATPGVLGIGELRLRWLGHRLRAECAVVVDDGLSLVAAHRIAVHAEHRLIHDVPKLRAALVHPDPKPANGLDHHEDLAHHLVETEPDTPPTGR